MMAMPWPPPMHIVSRPNCPSRAARPLSSVVVIRAPVAPNGWPRAIAPPWTLSRSGSMPRSSIDASTCTANASLISTRSMSDMDLVEINEAFAVQVLASMDDLGIDPDRLNVHGGAIALGHPFGATGARITTTLLNGLAARDGQFGLETMCIGGGQGMAIIYERLS